MICFISGVKRFYKYIFEIMNVGKMYLSSNVDDVVSASSLGLLYLSPTAFKDGTFINSFSATFLPFTVIAAVD